MIASYAALIVLAVVLAGMTINACAMGLRSFVALPLDQGGSVLRLFAERNDDANADGLTTEFAYGVRYDQTLILGLPYRLSPAGADRTGDLSLLYRYTAWREDRPDGTSRLGLLGGAVLATDAARDHRAQAGAVVTFYRNRHEWDLDFLWIDGLGKTPDAARYDVSWQYRLSPAVYPAWGIGSQWNAVLELGGRWGRGDAVTHQATVGGQYVQRQWVAEGGVVRDINDPHETRYIVSIRWHL